MADLGIIASVQPSHWVTAQFSDTVDEWGEERFATAYDYRALLDAGVTLSLGTDWPVWPTPDGLVQIWAAANHDESSIETAEALSAYTKGSAASVGRTLDLGALHVGMLSDMVVFDSDPLTAEPEDLTDINVTQVYVGGVRVD